MNQRIPQLLLGLGLGAMIISACGGNEQTGSPALAPSATSAQSTVVLAESDAPGTMDSQPAAADGSSADEEEGVPSAI